MVSDLLSSSEGSRGNHAASPLKTYTDIFYELFPFYLSIGMTEEQYWDRDSNLVTYYRKAEELRENRKNEELWLQGMYVYEAVGCVSPILHAFAKKGTKPLPYPAEPYALTKKQIDSKREEKEKATYEKGKRVLEAFMMSNNKKFEGK